MRTRRARRLGALTAVLALVGSALVAMVATAPTAGADTTQNNGCLGVTGGISQFAVPITGSASPDPAVLPTTITLSGTSVQIGVDATLIGSGVTTGLVTPSDSLANIGTDLTALGAPYDAFAPSGAGVNAVTSAIGSVKLRINGTNTAEGEQTAQNTAPVALTFYVVRDSTSGAISVYTDLSSPPSATPDPARTGTLLVGNLPVTIPLGDTTWTPLAGGTVEFSEDNVAPSNLLNPDVADQSAAPLILLPKINGAVNVPFWCWPGTVAAGTGNPLIPGPSSAIDSVTVTAPPAAPVCGGGTATVGGNQSITIDLNPKCTDQNGDWNSAGAGYPPGVPPLTIIAPTSPTTGVPCPAFPCNLAAGTINTTATPGVYEYTNTNPLAPAEGFGFVATDAIGQSSAPATFLITILANQCTATSSSCDLGQVITTEVIGDSMTLDQAASDITLGDVTLDGDYQITSGTLNELTVTNRRGTAAAWSLTGKVTDFANELFAGADCSTPDRNCIPGDNLAWGPDADIAHEAIPGDVAVVTPGDIGDGLEPWSTPLNGTGTGTTLCSAPANQSGGTFTCNATLWLGVPASAGAGTYTGVITLTLA